MGEQLPALHSESEESTHSSAKRNGGRKMAIGGLRPVLTVDGEEVRRSQPRFVCLNYLLNWILGGGGL